MTKKMLVCGATGFIGRNVVEYFARRNGYEVTAVCHNRPRYECKNVKWVEADLTTKADIERVLPGTDILVQLAATTTGAKDIVSRPYIHVTDNAVMNSLLFRAAHEHSVGQVLFPSCSIMYQPSDTPVREQDFHIEDGIFEKYFGAGWTKVYLENMCDFYSRFKKTKFVTFRHSNMYGPHDKYDLERSHVFGATMTKVMTAPEGGTIEVWGTGEEERDLLHVYDLVGFMECAIERQKDYFSLVNVGYGSSLSVRDLVRKIIDLSGRKIEIKFDPTKPSIKTKLALDASRAEKEYGWKPKIKLDDGIRQTIEWYREHVLTK